MTAFALAVMSPAAHAVNKDAMDNLSISISMNPFMAVILAFLLASAIALIVTRILYRRRLNALRAERDALAAALDARGDADEARDARAEAEYLKG